jgi:hypothetical protein
MTNIIYHYKIRNRTTGLYSKGGMDPVSWSKSGKTWTTIGGLMNHLSYLKRGDWQIATRSYINERYEIPGDWEIITIEIRADEQAGILVADFIRNRKPNAPIVIK